MPIKPVRNATTNTPVTTACYNCGVEERLLLHNVSHRGTFRRLCTTCVLRLHPRSFCPSCFQVYPPPPQNGAVLTCFKCRSSTHSRCIAAGPTPLPSPYICPLCINPSIPIFKLKTAKEANAVEGLSVDSEECRVMDRDAAKKLLAAAKIVSASMNEAAAAAKAEAERRAKEAAFMRKRAKEALEHVAYLLMKEKLRKKEEALPPSGKLARSGLGGVGLNVAYVDGGFRSAKANPVSLERKINAIHYVDGVDNSNQVLATTDTAESREIETMEGVTVLKATADDDQVDMDVDENERIMANAGQNDGGLVLDWSDVSDIDQMLFSDEETGADKLE